MEGQREDFDALLAHLAKELEMRGPHEIASLFAITMYDEFTRNGIKVRIDTAISFAQMSLSYEQNKPEITNSLLSDLGVFLQNRYEQVGHMADLEDAIQIARRTVASTPEVNSDLAMYLNNLGSKLQSRYQRTRDRVDLEEAIQVARRAVALTPKDHYGLAGRLNNLSNTLHNRYERTGNVSDLEEAIQFARRAVASTPEDDSNLAMYLKNLGNKLERRYERMGDMSDLIEENRVFCRSWTSCSSIPFTRIYAASRCLKLLFHLKQYNKAVEIVVSVTDLLPIVNARSLDRNDRHLVVSSFAGIVADACGVLL